MPKFVLKQFNNVVGSIKFFKLIEDTVCHWDNFCIEIQKDSNLKSQLITIVSRMNQIANMERLPDVKFKDITPKKDLVKEYEIKTNDLRVYLIKDELGNLVILVGKKNTQKTDINKFRSLKKAYLNSK